MSYRGPGGASRAAAERTVTLSVLSFAFSAVVVVSILLMLRVMKS